MNGQNTSIKKYKLYPVWGSGVNAGSSEESLLFGHAR